MTQTKNDPKKSLVRMRIRQNFNDNKKLFFIILIMQLLGLPFISVMLHVTDYEKKDVYEQYNSVNDLYLVIPVILFSLACVSGILLAFRCFRYLHKKSVSDMNLALPLSTSDRFLSDYLSGLLMYIIPYIIAAILTLPTLHICHSIYPKLLDGTTILSLFPYYALCGLLVMLMLYTLTVLITICCGNIIECIVYTIAINIIIPLFLYMSGLILFKDTIGIHSHCNEVMLNIITKTSPFGGVLNIAISGDMTDMSFYFDNNPFRSVVSSGWLFYYLPTTVIMFFISYFLYKKRKAEDVSKPFVFRFVYYAFIAAMTICLCGSVYRFIDAPTGIVLSAVAFLVFEIIKNRGFRLKKTLRSGICYAFSLIILFSVLKLNSITDGFGQIYRIPDDSDIKAVSIECDCLYTGYPEVITLYEKENIEAVTQIHRDTLDFYKENQAKYRELRKLYTESEFQINTISDSCNPDETDNNYQQIYKSIAIIYQYNNGDRLYRSYYVPYSVISRYIPQFSASQSCREQLTKEFESELYNCYGTNIYRFGTQYAYTYYDNDNMRREFIEAYKKDIMNQTIDDILNYKTRCCINNFYIGESFTNTINVLEKYKDEVNETGKTDKITANNLYFADSDQVIRDNELGTDIITNSCGIPYKHRVKECNEETLAELAKVAEESYYTTEHCYVMAYYHSIYIIPPEYSELAEKFISQCEFY